VPADFFLFGSDPGCVAGTARRSQEPAAGPSRSLAGKWVPKGSLGARIKTCQRREALRFTALQMLIGRLVAATIGVHGTPYASDITQCMK
jgi:hypothetical protein